MRILKGLALLVSFVAAVGAGCADAQTFKYKSTGFLAPSAINSLGATAGNFCCAYVPYIDGPQETTHAYSLKGKGFKVSEPSGAASSFASAIRFNGDVVGGYCSANSGGCSTRAAMHGYMFTVVDNSTVTIDVPGALSTVASGINRAGQIVGSSCNATACDSDDGGGTGFLLDKIGGTFTTIDFPGAVNTAASAINDTGIIVGNYAACKTGTSSVLHAPCSELQLHGYQLIGGTYSTIDPAGSVATNVDGINNSGEVVGTYLDGNNKTHGFLFNAGAYVIVDAPGADVTVINGVNDQGQIVGWAQIGYAYDNFVGTPQ
jgi:probable HAF family extracellular repeat protein